ncbi:unnamed protein product [Sympodiomycopsis kandeliae]
MWIAKLLASLQPSFLKRISQDLQTMVYVKHWSDFHNQSISLYKQRPNKTRYLLKSHPSKQWLVLKVTDDHTVLKYRSRSTVILNRLETFNRELNQLMSGGEVAAAAAEQSASVAAPTATTTTAQAQSQTPATTNSNSNSSNKKKKKKGGK